MFTKSLGKMILPTTPQQIGAVDQEHVRAFIQSQNESMKAEAKTLEINFEIVPNKITGIGDVSIISPQNATEQTPCLLVYIGNDNCVQKEYPQLLEFCQKLNCRVIATNYPGIASNAPQYFTYQETVKQGEKLFDLVKTKYPKSEKTIIYGHSFGGAVATDVALYAQDKKIDFYLINDRSFSKASTKAYQETIHNTPLENIPSFPSVSKALIRKTMKNAAWEIDVVKKYNQIDSEKKCCFQIKGDGYIKDIAALLPKVDQEKSPHQFIFSDPNENIEKSEQLGDPHNYSLADIAVLEGNKNGLQIIAERVGIKYADGNTVNQENRASFYIIQKNITNYLMSPNNINAFNNIGSELDKNPQVIWHHCDENNAFKDQTLLHMVIKILLWIKNNPELSDLNAENKAETRAEKIITLLLNHGGRLDQNSLPYKSVAEYAKEAGFENVLNNALAQVEHHQPHR